MDSFLNITYLTGSTRLRIKLRPGTQDKLDFFPVSGHRPIGPIARRDETVKIASAYRRNIGNHVSKIEHPG